jgi:hypothetical protein
MEITSLKKRVSILEMHKRNQYYSIRSSHLPVELPELPQINQFTNNHRSTSKKNQTSELDGSQDLKSELTLVLKRDVKLKPVEQAKQEELHELHVSVHEEFKNISKQQIISQLTSDLEKSLTKFQKKLNK